MSGRVNASRRVRNVFACMLALAAPMAGGCADVFTLLSPLPPVADAESFETEERRSNVPPAAVAGEDAAFDAGELIVLDGTGSSDADGDRLTYFWTQVDGGPAVELKGQFSSISRFDAPADLDGETTLTFRLTVVDGRAFSTDEIQVTIRPVQ